MLAQAGVELLAARRLTLGAGAGDSAGDRPTRDSLREPAQCPTPPSATSPSTTRRLGLSGEPLLLIMGLGGDLQACPTAPALAKKFRVITFDNRGAGRTSAADKPYSIEQMAADAVGLLDHLEIEKAHVLGFSMGGYIAQELALRSGPGAEAHPPRHRRLRRRL